MIQWDATTPIYRQVRDRLVAEILEGRLQETDAAPSVRQFAAEASINPLTVSRAYQELVDAGVLRTTLNERFGEINAGNLRRAHAWVESGAAIGKGVLEGF